MRSTPWNDEAKIEQIPPNSLQSHIPTPIRHIASLLRTYGQKTTGKFNRISMLRQDIYIYPSEQERVVMGHSIEQ